MIKKRTYEFEISDGEYWWGGAAFDAPEMPFSKKSEFRRCLDPNSTMNQSAPLLVSNKGRYIWSDNGFIINISGGKIILESSKGAPKIYEGFNDLRGAYLEACRSHFAPRGKMPPKEFFINPQFNTWIEYTYYQKQSEILEYAEKIKSEGYPCSVFMIDCGWQRYNGNWEFRTEDFPAPRQMVEKLHKMGYKVMLWICPFIAADTIEYRFARDNNLLITAQNGNPAMIQWWDGFSAALDFTNPKAEEYFVKVAKYLMEKYDIDGFKMDAGDAYFYNENDVTFQPADGNRHSELWAKAALNFEYNELRACFKCGLDPIVQRLCDKLHEWDYNGVASLVPCMLAQGLIGSPFGCPDMIGGGDYVSFSKERMKNTDSELFVRYAQNSALMPMMQFSAAPWRVLGAKDNELCKQAAQLHSDFSEKIVSLAQNAAKTGEPIVRYMEYVFPHCNYQNINDQFMLGNDILVAPVTQKNVQSRKIVLPKGNWRDLNGKVFEGNREIIYPAPLDVLPVFLLENN